MTNHLWNIQNQAGIAEAKTDAAHATNRVRDLEASLDRMALVSQALWEILRTRLAIPEEELLSKINDIDLRDGNLDQRMTSKIVKCPKCARALNSKNTRCYYCGATLQKEHVFQ